MCDDFLEPLGRQECAKSVAKSGGLLSARREFGRWDSSCETVIPVETGKFLNGIHLKFEVTTPSRNCESDCLARRSVRQSPCCDLNIRFCRCLLSRNANLVQQLDLFGHGDLHSDEAHCS